MQDMVTKFDYENKRKAFYHGDVMVVSYVAKGGRFEMVGLKKDNQTQFILMWNTEQEAEEYFTYVKENYIRSVLGLQNKPTLTKKAKSMAFTKTRSRNGNSARFMYDDEVIVQYDRQDDGNWLLTFNDRNVPTKLVSTKVEAVKIFIEVSENFKSFIESSNLVEELKDKLEQEEHNNTDKYRAYLESIGSSID